MRVSRILKSIFENVNRSERMRKESCSVKIAFDIHKCKLNQFEHKKLSISIAFDLLNIPETASKREIHKAYIKQAKIYHPDVVGKLDPEEQAKMFQSVSEAYEILIGKSEDEPEEFHEGDDLAEEDFTGYEKISSIAYAKHVLGVEPNATSDEVDQAYKLLSLQYHPDLNDELRLVLMDRFQKTL